jgi:acetyltransferase-like isoleucine patch superfamily enzyme
MFIWSDYIHGSDDLLKDLPWEMSVEDFVKKNSKDDIFIHPTSVVEEGVVLKGPVFIGPNCFVGAHAYLRGGVYLIGNNSIGPGCELKSCILFPNTNLAHFNFIGDSIVGSNVNFEAGSIVANHFNERTEKEITVTISGKKIKTGSAKFGAVIGDGCKIGANAVLSPGTILEKNSVVARQQLINQDSMENRNGIQWKELFVNKAFDLVMVILGVSIAFQLNNWKMNSDQKSLEKFYKESLLVDVNSDIEEINSIMDEISGDQVTVENYLEKMDNLPADSLLDPLQAILTFETFTGNRNTYETLVAIGLNTFTDREVIDKLTDYYSSYTSIRRFESVYTSAIFMIHQHFSEYVIYDPPRVVNKSVVSLAATKNSLLVADGQLNDGLEDYRDALKRAEALKTALEKGL